jgi:hypothetical protein
MQTCFYYNAKAKQAYHIVVLSNFHQPCDSFIVNKINGVKIKNVGVENDQIKTKKEESIQLEDLIPTHFIASNLHPCHSMNFNNC